MYETKPIAETKNFIVLDKYEKINQVNEPYQSEYALESELIADLQKMGYEYVDFKSNDALYKNLKTQIETLNSVKFSDSEWERFLSEYLDKENDGIVEKTRKIQDDFIYDFVFDDGHIQNIYLLDKEDMLKNKLQVMRQFEQRGSYKNRYDVTILVNGLPLIHIELKKRGVALKEAFNQIHRYQKESFNTTHSLFKYIQIFVISNGTDTRYFANTTKRDKNSFDFTANWALADNTPIKDLKDFTFTFFEKRTLLSVLCKYCVFDTNNTLLILRPYQIAAVERILWKIQSTYNAKNWGKERNGGYIWHTTGSGKTLTSFKAARLATKLRFIDKVLFVVDRKDLDYQTIKEYQRFSPDSVNGSSNTAGLKKNLQKDDNKIVVTTIQKLNNLIKSEKDLAIYNKHVVFIFDEAHRSQFGEAQKNIKKRFKKYYQFGFTGTPIFPQNALGSETTASVFGIQLHTYVITDAIRDEKVLKFKVDYNDVRARFKEFEKLDEDDIGVEALASLKYGTKVPAPDKISGTDVPAPEVVKKALLHPERIKQITEYILKHFNQKTHKFGSNKGFNAIFAVSSVEAAKLYYDEFKKLQAEVRNPLKVATIFSFAQNEEQNAIGEIEDESFEPTALNLSAKEFLQSAIDDYNEMFKTSYGLDSKSFQNYYKDVAKRVREREVDLLIVVGMFLTGFDAPTLNTLFVDKNLRYHGLIQAYSRTNRIYDATKPFGNIVTFRDLEQATIDAITLFGDKNTKNIILEKSFREYLEGFDKSVGFVEVIKELKEKFPNPANIEKESDKKEFVKLFGKYLRLENILQNFDEFEALQELQKIDINDEKEIEEFKQNFHLSDKEFKDLAEIELLPIRLVQDYKSTYNDIREWIRSKESNEDEKSTIDWDDIVFEVDLLKSQEINLDFILELILDKHKEYNSKDELIEEIKRVIKASIGYRAKEGLIVDFINQTELDKIKDVPSILESFYTYAKGEQQKELRKLIAQEKLKEKEAKRYIELSLKRGYASKNGTELNELLPKISPLNPKYLEIKNAIFEKISAFIERFKEI